MVPALVLTAGLATRLRPLSLVRAKGALPVGHDPLVRRILRQLAAAGITDAVLNLHHLPHTLTAVVGDGADLGLRVRYSWEVPVLGSAGGPRKALPLLLSAGSRQQDSAGSTRQDPAYVDVPPAGSTGQNPAYGQSTFLIVNGDTLTDVDIRTVVEHHRRTRALVTMAVIPNHAPEKYGGVLVEAEGVVTGFVGRGSSKPSFHFVGVQVAEAEAFAAVPPDIPHESVGALYPALIQSRPGAIQAFRTTAEFMDIGTASDYLETALRITAREGYDVATHARAQVHHTARIERSVLWDDVVVEAGAMVKDCVVTDGVRVPADTSWHGVTLRLASGDLVPGEKRIDGLAIGSL